MMTLRFCPSTWTLHAGILESGTSPPATPISLAATVEPWEGERGSASRTA